MKRSQTKLLLSLAAAVVAACGSSTTDPVPSISASTYLRATDCGPSVSRHGEVIDVSPTGADDTASLQCAIDAAIAAGRPMSIRLAAGTFHTSQLVAKGFNGRLAGSGKDATVLANPATPMFVTPLDFYLAEPSATNPWPSLLAFVDGDFKVSDLTIQVLDEAPTTGWSIFGIMPPIKALAHEIVIVGTSARASVERVAFVGKVAPSDQLFGMNIYNAVFFEGILGPPIAGAFSVRDSAFIEVAAGAVAVNLKDARVSVLDNTSHRTTWPVQIADLDRTEVLVAGNRFQDGAAGIQILDGCAPGEPVCGLRDTRLAIAGNQLSEVDGVEVIATFGEGVRCAVVGNQIQYDPAVGGVAVWLGPGTKDCLVVTRGAVKDQGVGNRVIAIP